MSSSTIVRLRNPHLFDLAAYLTLAILVVVSVIVYPSALVRAQTIALCVGFGLVYRLGYYAIRNTRQATTYFATQLALLVGVIVLAGTSDVFGLLFFILGIQAVLTLPRQSAMLWVVLFYAVDSVGAVAYRGADGAINVLFNAAVYLLVFVFASALRQAETARLENEALLGELRLAQRHAHDLAVAEERNRLARELHDSVKQQVFATTMQLGAARVLLGHDPLAAQAHVIEAEQLAQQAGAELSLLIHELRPIALNTTGLAAALRAYGRDWSRQTTIQATVNTSGEHPLPPATEHALLRVAQEALANVARHSGATGVRVDLAYAAATVTLTVADNGHGFDPEAVTAGVGLASMRERITALGGRVGVTSVPGAGTTVFVECGGSDG